MSERRVVITGIGCVSPLGNDLETTWDGLKNGRSGIRRIENIDATPFDCKIAGEIRDFNADGYFGVPKDARRSDRYVQYAVAASKMAMTDSGIDTAKIDARRYGVMVGSGIGGLSTVEREHSVYIEKGPRRVSPFTIPMMISNIASGIISMEHGLLGPNMVIVTACATSNHNIGEAWRIIKFGDADGFLCGGAEAAVLPMGLCGFANMKALSTRNDEPEKASRPFDKHRDGFVMGEGAGVVMIEELETAKARGAKIYAELIGYGVSADAYHLSAPSPDGSGPAYAIGMALKHGKKNPEDVGYLNAHATSTGLGDVAETKAIKLAFGDYAKNGLMVSSTKSMTGHMLGAAGGIELIASVMAIVDGVIPPTINIEEQDPECDLDVVPNVAREVPIKVALSNSFGFGGHNASVLVSKFEAERVDGGKIILVPTPIGNLGDITLRALDVLKSADRIACEDTRHSGILLAHHGITGKPLVSLHEHNESRKAPELVAAAKAGERIAFISDAGMPGVSDPGYRLVQACLEADVPFEVLPGPSAVLMALIGSGLPCHAFRFGGFLSVKSGKRRSAMLDVIESGETGIFFESPHRIVSTLEILAEIAPEAKVCVARELTKKFETYHRGKPGELLEWFKSHSAKGEMVILMNGA